MRPRQLIPLAVLLLIALHLPHARASAETGSPTKVFDPSRTPVRPAPPTHWTGGLLRPSGILLDSTGISGEPSDSPFIHELALSGPYLFAATGMGLYTIDVSKPTPLRYPYADASSLAPIWGHSDKNFFITSVASPPGTSNLVVTGAEDFGLLIWNTANKGNVKIHYQDSDTFVRNVYAATIDRRHFAFAVDGKDLRAYDMTAASSLHRCADPGMRCPAVYLGILESGATTNAYVTGSGRFVVYRNLSRVTIFAASWADGRLTLTAKLVGQLSDFTYLGELALWSHGGRHYLAVAVGNLARQGEVRIHDVSCIASPGLCALSSPTAYPTPDASSTVPPLTLDVSFNKDGRPYLYIGTSVISSAKPICTPQREYLFDVNATTRATEITPKVHPSGYWGWYYEPCYGYNYTAPRHALVHGSTLYRAAFGFLDSHLITSPLPTVEIFSDGFESGSTSAWSGTSLGRP